MNSPVRQPLWQGHQRVAALWFDAQLYTAAQREQLLLAAWQPRAQALRLNAGDLLCFAQPHWRDCAQGQGLPLCRVDGTLLSGPLRDDERRRLAGADLGLIGGAQVQALRLSDGVPLDLSRHIALNDYALHETFEFAPAPRERTPPPMGKALRDILDKKIPPPSAGVQKFFQSLRQRQSAHAPRRPGLLQRALGWLARTASDTATPPHDGGALAQRRSKSVPQAWRHWLAKMATLSGAARLVGWRQGIYLRRLLDLFDRQDLDEALRHALPLDGKADASLGQSFGAPGRRTELSLSSGLGASTGIGLPAQLREHLRQLYRQAFQRLDRAGRVDEAVFVLAELLNARQEALDYLLRHDRAVQAAELALGWDMPAGSIVRLLLLAGDTRRALLVARRDNAFADAVALLQDSHAELAGELRREWGRSLVVRGEWLLAVDAVWPLADMHDEATRWLTAAEAAGAVFGARALVQRAIVLPDSLARQAARLDTLADPASAPAERAAVAQMLLASPQQNEALSRLTALLLPALAADRAQNQNSLSGKELDRLRTRARDRVLDADLPGWQLPHAGTVQPLLKRKRPLLVQPPAAGLHGISDAAFLAPGRYLVALGEIGAAVVDASGQTLQRYAVPAHDLVMADNGRVALAVARRENRMRVTRLDLVNQRMSDLGELPLQRFNRRFDGLRWSVCSSREIQQLDTANSELNVLWQVETPGLIGVVSFDGDNESYLVHTPQGFEHWCYEGTQRRLAVRQRVDPDPQQQPLLFRRAVRQAALERDSQGALQLRYTNCPAPPAPATFALTDPLAAVSHCANLLLDSMVLAALSGGEALHYRIFRFDDPQCVLQLDWPGPTAQVCHRGAQLLWVDGRGRLLHLDMDTQQVCSFSLR
ncbi:hypothetical protein DFR29_108128 [Tahibacter aquaticus]|uniref:MoxR-vWA-beta-propeller ternary system domain-containing protein n=1 Tax=Tahibacter aquaticus TaxID=520092 RepID=A0A4R6YVL3_9GAMM|nr:bpX6 domain-containing protein [Tahibacter aquaticus]TDR42544.1 hypothetical protein DFR29_108128 [Tahibacter aquaticus]